MISYSKNNQHSEWQTIKQGAVFYIILTFLVIPSGICSQQDNLPVFHPTAVELHAMFDLSPLWGDFDFSATRPGETDGTEAKTLEVDTAEANDSIPVVDPPFHNFVLQAAQEYGVDVALIRAIIMAESNYNPRAVSNRGAQGLMQLMPSTARWLGVDDSFNPAANIDAGVRYFKRLLDRFKGDIKLALAAYNAGSRYVRKYNGVPPFKATRTYIKKVMDYHRHFSDEMAANELNASAV